MYSSIGSDFVFLDIKGSPILIKWTNSKPWIYLWSLEKDVWEIYRESNINEYHLFSPLSIPFRKAKNYHSKHMRNISK